MSRTALAIGVLVCLAAFGAVVLGKQRSMVAAHRGLDEIGWDSIDWTPPKLQLGDYQKQG